MDETFFKWLKVKNNKNQKKFVLEQKNGLRIQAFVIDVNPKQIAEKLMQKKNYDKIN